MIAPVGEVEQPLSNASQSWTKRLYRGLRWWLRVVEVRLRFVVLVFIILAVVTQWKRLRQAWDDTWYAWSHPLTAAGVSGSSEYFCPMDPGVVAVWPGICPICNMDLVQRKKHDAQLLPEGVVARMQISPYRVQLAGIRTAEVETRELIYRIPVAGELSLASELDSANGALKFAFDAPISRDDQSLLIQPREAIVWPITDRTAEFDAVADLRPAAATRGSRVSRARLTISAGAKLAAGMQVRGEILVPAAETRIKKLVESASAPSSEQNLLAVPESAIVDHGDRQLVFVESMPGTFDAVVVEIGRRCGDYYPVLNGLQAKQRIAVAGAFLIDAESRLNPSLSVSYFGANQASAPGRVPDVLVASSADTKKGPKLSPDEVALAEKQKTCPVTGLPLDSMGGPVVTVVSGRKVLLCCKGCETKLKEEPAKYLAKLPPP